MQEGNACRTDNAQPAVQIIIPEFRSWVRKAVAAWFGDSRLLRGHVITQQALVAQPQVDYAANLCIRIFNYTSAASAWII